MYLLCNGDKKEVIRVPDLSLLYAYSIPLTLITGIGGHLTCYWWYYALYGSTTYLEWWKETDQ
jgi:hypothetical protein